MIKEAQTDYSGSKSKALHNSLAATTPGRGWLAGFVLCSLAFVACILLTVTPLIRMPDPAISLHISLGSVVGTASTWLPLRLGRIHQSSSNSLEFFALLSLAFLLYCLSMFLVGEQRAKDHQFPVRLCIWSVTILAGAIYIVTPALLSHDMMVYASYGRLLTAYHANPYFVPLSSFPHDPFVQVDQWSQTTSAYGPVWILVCGLLGSLLRPDPTTFAIAFRLVALAADLLNIWLVGKTLQTMGRSPRAVTLGMLFYAWNPLVLLESALDGHNDVFMLTFVLIGILLAARAERNGLLLCACGYTLPAAALTMAALVKFPACPVLAAYLLFLGCKALRPTTDNSQRLRLAFEHWKRAFLVLCGAGFAALLTAALFYGPFWFGHGLPEISRSFGDVPPSTGAKNSFMSLIINWSQLHPTQTSNHLLAFLGLRRVWDDITYLAIALCLLLGFIQLWRKPAFSTFQLLALATMCIALFITPWFYPWYIIWLIGLAAVCLPTREKRAAWAFCALALTFSYSALSLYISGFLATRVYLWPLFDTFPPLCAFLLCWTVYPALRNALKTKRLTLFSERYA